MEADISFETGATFSEIKNRLEYAKLFSTLDYFSDGLRRLGYGVSPYSTYSVLRLPQTPLDKIEKIIEHFEKWGCKLESASEVELPEVSKLEMEISFAKEVLEHHGLKADDSFWKTIEENQIIEIYGSEMIQIYRSFNFFKYCGYSLLDVSLNEWYLLWSRPRMILEKINEEIQTVMKDFVPVKPLEVPKHMLREILDTGDTEPFVPRAALCQFKHIGSLRASSLAKPSGLICTATSEIIALGDEVKSLGMV